MTMIYKLIHGGIDVCLRRLHHMEVGVQESSTDVGVVQHQVHKVEGAEAGSRGEDAEPPGSDMEQEQEWEQRAGWGRAARGRKQVLDEGQAIAPEETGVE